MRGFNTFKDDQIKEIGNLIQSELTLNKPISSVNDEDISSFLINKLPEIILDTIKKYDDFKNQDL